MVGVCTNPVVRNRLVGKKEERVPLACKYLYRIHHKWLCKHPIRFNDGLDSMDQCSRNGEIQKALLWAHHGMVVDGEDVVRIARNRDEAEPVTNKRPNVDDRKRDIGSAGIASESVDQCSIRRQDKLAFGRDVIPNTHLTSTHLHGEQDKHTNQRG